MFVRNAHILTVASLFVFCCGCGTTTQRLGTEQLLLSSAVDGAVSQIDFTAVRNQKVFLDTNYIDHIPAANFVNSKYITSAIRQQMLAARCLLMDKPEDADVIVELRVGALGADGHEVTYGLPKSSALGSAASLISNAPTIPVLPDLSLGRSDAQSAIARLAVFAYYRETREPIWQSGIAKGESNSRSTWILGAGPFQRGSIYNGTRFAGRNIKDDKTDELQARSGIGFDQEYLFPGNPALRTAEVLSDDDDSTIER